MMLPPELPFAHTQISFSAYTDYYHVKERIGDHVCLLGELQWDTASQKSIHKTMLLRL